jgi:hypothetical protein
MAINFKTTLMAKISVTQHAMLYLPKTAPINYQSQLHSHIPIPPYHERCLVSVLTTYWCLQYSSAYNVLSGAYTALVA